MDRQNTTNQAISRGVNQMATESASIYYRRFLAAMALLWITGSGIVFHWGTPMLALAYAAGFITPLLFAFLAPTYSEPDPGSDLDSEGVN